MFKCPELISQGSLLAHVLLVPVDILHELFSAFSLTFKKKKKPLWCSGYVSRLVNQRSQV